MNKRDDFLSAILFGAFFAGLFALGWWGWANASTEDSVKLFVLAWAALTWLIYMFLRSKQ